MTLPAVVRRQPIYSCRLAANQDPALKGCLTRPISCNVSERLAHPGRTGEQDRVALGDPIERREAHERFAIDAAAGGAVDVLNRGTRVLELCVLQQPCLSAITAGVDLADHQQCEPFHEAQGVDAGLTHLFVQSGGEPLELECAQLVDSGVIEHGRCPWRIRYHS